MIPAQPKFPGEVGYQQRVGGLHTPGGSRGRRRDVERARRRRRRQRRRRRRPCRARWPPYGMEEADRDALARAITGRADPAGRLLATIVDTCEVRPEPVVRDLAATVPEMDRARDVAAALRAAPADALSDHVSADEVAALWALPADDSGSLLLDLVARAVAHPSGGGRRAGLGAARHGERGGPRREAARRRPPRPGQRPVRRGCRPRGPDPGPQPVDAVPPRGGEGPGGRRRTRRRSPRCSRWSRSSAPPCRRPSHLTGSTQSAEPARAGLPWRRQPARRRARAGGRGGARGRRPRRSPSRRRSPCRTRWPPPTHRRAARRTPASTCGRAPGRPDVVVVDIPFDVTVGTRPPRVAGRRLERADRDRRGEGHRARGGPRPRPGVARALGLHALRPHGHRCRPPSHGHRRLHGHLHRGRPVDPRIGVHYLIGGQVVAVAFRSFACVDDASQVAAADGARTRTSPSSTSRRSLRPTPDLVVAVCPLRRLPTSWVWTAYAQLVRGHGPDAPTTCPPWTGTSAAFALDTRRAMQSGPTGSPTTSPSPDARSASGAIRRGSRPRCTPSSRTRRHGRTGGAPAHRGA